MKTITVKRRTLQIYSVSAVVLVTIILGYYFLFYNPSFLIISTIQPPAIEAKFAVLSKTNTNSCGGTFSYVDSMPDDARIQGSCCSAMDFHRYSEQIDGLQEYSEYEKIPPDPYDVPVLLARELLDYQKNIQLTLAQQSIYDEAVGLSHEGGPCCCKCWHWYAYEGLAKYLITKEGFTAEQIAEVWDLSDACGGSGHTEGVSGH